MLGHSSSSAKIYLRGGGRRASRGTIITRASRSLIRSTQGRTLIVVLAVMGATLVSPVTSGAVAGQSHWVITSASSPTYFKPGDTADRYTVIATNDGSASASAVTVTDTLPSGVTATNISGFGKRELNFPLECSISTLTCVIGESIPEVAPGESVVITITVSVAVDVPASISNSATVTDGDARNASVVDPTQVSDSLVPYGASYFTSDVTGQDGNTDTQAGSHPFAMTSTFAFNVAFLATTSEVAPFLNAEAKDIDVELPPGLIGNPGAVPTCPQISFETVSGAENCPADTQVGTLRVFFYGGETAQQLEPVFNIAPPAGQPAELGFTVAGFAHIPMFFQVRSTGDYGLTAQLSGISEADPVQAGVLTLWGVPADSAHDFERRGSTPVGCDGGGCASNVEPKPFLSLPTRCQSEPLVLSMFTDSWQDQLSPPVSPPSAAIPGPTGCESLSFSPRVSVLPEGTQAGAPSGYTVDIRVPQNEDPNGLATPDLRNAAVTLPAGTVISPSAADGLSGCSDEQFALKSLAEASCPKASQVGSVRISTPLLSNPLEGQLFLGTPNCAPCGPEEASDGRMIRLFLQAQGSGVIVKLDGSTSVNQTTGQLTTTFDETPQLPFEDLKLTINGGSRAPLANPSTCATALAASSRLTPYSSTTPAESSSEPFEVDGCSGSQFAPTFTAGTTNNNADSYSPFTATFRRSDQDQDFSKISVHTPPGLLGVLANVTLCGEVQANAGTCSSASQIGHTTTFAGPGPSPVTLPQTGEAQDPVFLTTGFDGQPFGLSIVVPAKAGPFNLGTVVVRASIAVDPVTSALTITSNPLPTMLDGVPLQIKTVNVTVDRADFMFNPTSCAGSSVSSSITSTEGEIAALSSPFGVANCATLPFKPKFSASTAGRASKADGASLDVKVGSKGGPQAGGGEANIRSVKVDLPKQLPSRLTTLQKACLASVFTVNPANCPAQSNVGTGTAATPILAHVLSGPAYLVSHGGEAFPDLEIVLQGEGITLILDGNTSIKKGITSSTFKAVPDAPISSFELKLPTGKYSVLGANVPQREKYSLCGQTLTMPTAITGQNGAVVKQTTNISIAGCSKVKKSKKPGRKRATLKKKGS
jgi:uncharacterized repeat protein (TIGR01451 family)